MKLITIGDSITKGTYFDDDSGTYKVAKPNYSEILQNLFEAEVVECFGCNGVSMSSTSPTNPEQALCRLCKDAIKGDVIVVAGGTNDFGNSVEVGGVADEMDISTCGAAHILFTCLKKNNPNADIYTVLPIPRKNENVPNKRGYILDDYRNAICEVAVLCGVSVIDGKRLSINPENEKDRKQYMPDGLHPNTAGHAVYGQFIYREILELKEKAK